MRMKFAVIAAVLTATLASAAAVSSADAQRYYYGGRHWHHHHWRDRGAFGLSIGTPTYYGGPYGYYGCPYGYYGPGCYQPSYYAPYTPYYGGANFSLSVPIR